MNPASAAEDSEYENGVADVLAFLVPHATVERNVKLRGALSETRRQLDVVVRGEMFGRHDAMLIVDAKRWKSKTPDVPAVVLALARHSGALVPDGAVQTEFMQLAHETLATKDIAFDHVAHGVVAEGGTPGARWIPLRVGDTELPRVLAASTEELEEKIRSVARACGVSSELVSAERPEGGPFEPGFTFDALDGLLFEPE